VLLLPGHAIAVNPVVVDRHLRTARIGVRTHTPPVPLRGGFPGTRIHPASISARDDRRELWAGPAQLGPRRWMAVMAGANARHHPSCGVSHVRSVGALATDGVRIRLGVGTSGVYPGLVRTRPSKRPSLVGSGCSGEYFCNHRTRGVLACSG